MSAASIVCLNKHPLCCATEPLNKRLLPPPGNPAEATGARHAGLAAALFLWALRHSHDVVIVRVAASPDPEPSDHWPAGSNTGLEKLGKLRTAFAGMATAMTVVLEVCVVSLLSGGT